jgi:hypothetical protein
MFKLLLKGCILIVAAVVGYIVLNILRNYIHAYTSPISVLPGPKRATLIRGSFTNEVPEPQGHRLLEHWLQTYGRAIRYHSFLGVLT